jgi:hypothetical protein
VCDWSDAIAETIISLSGGAIPQKNVQYEQ